MLLFSFAFAAAVFPALFAAALPANASINVPFNTNKQWVQDSTGANFTYVGVNWPGAADVMIPEGLQYASIESIVSKLKSIKMNVVRLTFAIEMIDDIKNNGSDVTVQNAFNKALGSTNGTKVYQQVLKNNPQFNDKTTRLQVYDAIAAELNKQGIYVHLDNHMSKGAWCCDSGDGNSWFGDTYFDVNNWKRGLEFMADHGKQWPNLISIGLRNELRSGATNGLPYDWATWYDQVIPAADIVNKANPNILIFLSGLDFDTKMAPIATGADLGSGKKFLLKNFTYANKLVIELHNYQNSITDCGSMESGLWNNGFSATGEEAVNRMPVVLTEFGFSQEGSDYTTTYATCIKKLMPQWKTGWMYWVLAGSYYIRSGTQDYEETWGLLNHDWSDWRSASAMSALQGMIDASLKG